MNESAGTVESLKKVQSVRNGGAVTRKEPKNEPLPEEMLSILVDLLRKIESSGIEVELVPDVTREGKKGIGFLVMGVEIIEKRIRRIKVPEKA